MKTDTPRTDALERANSKKDVYSSFFLMRDFAKELERELTAVTEQRDMLAEALTKAKAIYTPSSGGEYQTGWLDAIRWVNQQALQSLTTNEL